MYGIKTMLTLGMKKEFSHVLTFSAVINICLVVPLSLYYSGEDVAFSMLLSEIFVISYIMLLLYKRGILLDMLDVKL